MQNHLHNCPTNRLKTPNILVILAFLRFCIGETYYFIYTSINSAHFYEDIFDAFFSVPISLGITSFWGQNPDKYYISGFFPSQLTSFLGILFAIVKRVQLTDSEKVLD